MPDGRRVTIADKAFTTYLNDHLAGATFGADLARRLRDWTAGSPHGGTLDTVAAEIESDRETLIAVMERLGVARSSVKQATTWIGEKFSRVKLSGATGEEPTALFSALETLALGVEGKRCLWRTLRDLAEDLPQLDVAQLENLIARAEDQGRRLESERRLAGRLALLEAPAAD